MKSLSAWMGVFLLVVGLTICSSAVWGADWKEFAIATTGVFRYDAASITSPSGGVVRVWIINMDKNETNLVEIKCQDRSYQVLSVVQWDQAYQVKSREDYYDQPNPTWLPIPLRSVPEALFKIVCP
jgi:hypothetical protein